MSLGTFLRFIGRGLRASCIHFLDHSGPFIPASNYPALWCCKVFSQTYPCAHEGEWSTEHLPSWERVLLLEQLLLAKKRAYVSLAGSRLYQAACLVFAVLVPRPSFFLPLWFWEGELQRALRSLPCTPDPAVRGAASRLCSDTRTIVPVPACLRGVVQAKGHPRSCSGHLPLRRCQQTLCPFSASILVALLPPSLEDSHCPP